MPCFILFSFKIVVEHCLKAFKFIQFRREFKFEKLFESRCLLQSHNSYVSCFAWNISCFIILLRCICEHTNHRVLWRTEISDSYFVINEVQHFTMKDEVDFNVIRFFANSVKLFIFFVDEGSVSTSVFFDCSIIALSQIFSM